MQSELLNVAFAVSRANLLMRKAVSLLPPAEALKAHEQLDQLDGAARSLREAIVAMGELV